MIKNRLAGKTPTTIANHEYIRLNDVADRFGRRLDNWMKLESTVELIELFRKDCTNQEPLKVVKGAATVGRKTVQQGTWAHPILAEKFLEWCNRSPNKSSDSVYLICAVGVKMTKIGIAHNANNRIANLRIGSPIALELFRVEPSLIAREIEVRTHQLASKWHSHGEWFKVSGHEASKLLDKAINELSETFSRD